MAEPGVAISDLSLARAGRRVLDRLSVAAPARRVTALAGPSGSGKTTLLRCVNRLLEPPAGTVRVAGEDVTSVDVVALRRRVGMVMQRPAALPGTVAANVRYGPALVGRELGAGEVAELLEAVALPRGFADRPADELSGGELQRLALARCLANDPEVILLDEPTAALDPVASRAVGEAVARVVRGSGATVLWVTHDLEGVRGLADTLVLLDAGRVVAAGPPTELLDDPDGPAARFARGEHASGSPAEADDG